MRSLGKIWKRGLDLFTFSTSTKKEYDGDQGAMAERKTKGRSERKSAERAGAWNEMRESRESQRGREDKSIEAERSPLG